MTASPRTPAADRPEFTWDAVRLRLTWANQPGIAFWGEDSLLDLTERVFSPWDETVRALAVREAELADGASVARVTLYPQSDPVWALAECRAERRADGRALMWIGLDDIEAVNDCALVRKRAGFDAAPRPMVIFDDLGNALVRNEADRRSYPEAENNIDARYAEPGAGMQALARALAEGAFSHTAMIYSAPTALRHRISLRRMRDPATGRMCVIADFTDLSDRPPIELSAGQVAHPTVGTARASVSAEALARIAHDIRAPLSAISGFAEMLRVMGDAMPAERRSSALQDISAASQRLTDMTNRIIALAGGASAGQLNMVDLAAICESTARLYAAQAEASGITLTVKAESGPMALADESAVARILDNLIRNALTHGHSKGAAVTLSAGGGQNGEPAWIEVADNGPGISPEMINATLKTFRSQSVGDSPSLHGLGIANVMTLAQEMAAQVEIKTAPKEGFAARITFAVETAP